MSSLTIQALARLAVGREVRIERNDPGASAEVGIEGVIVRAIDDPVGLEPICLVVRTREGEEYAVAPSSLTLIHRPETTP